MFNAQQKAILIPSKGTEFALGTTDIPKPGLGQLLIRNEAVARNPVGWMIQTREFWVDKFPAVIGSDVAGVVAEIGGDVSGLTVGDRV